jgi:hypothetical protein
MGTGGTTTAIWTSAPVIVLFVAALGALLFGYWSWMRAWRIASQHEPFRALGFRKWVMGYAAVAHMPDEAVVHVRRHFFSVIAVVVCLLAVIAIVWIDAAR